MFEKYVINLDSTSGPQLNPFYGATKEQIFEMFQEALSLTDRGVSSDFYAIEDRKEAKKISQLMAEKRLNVAQVYCETAGSINSMKIEGRLRELAETPSINALGRPGLELAKVIQEGGRVFVVGSMRKEIATITQRLIDVRLRQLAEKLGQRRA